MPTFLIKIVLKYVLPGLAGLALLFGAYTWAKRRGEAAMVAKYQPVMQRALDAMTITAERIRAARAEAAAADLAHAREVEASQDKVTSNVSSDYQAQLAALRARYDRLLRAAPGGGTQAAGSGGGAAPVPGVPGSSGGPDGSAGQAGLSAPDALIASEQALQLESLQSWVRQQAAVPR